MNWSLSLSGSIAADIVLMPNIKTAKPNIMPPVFFLVGFPENIQSAIPISATTPVRISVLKYSATLAPDPPMLFKQRIQPVMLVPKIAPRMTLMA